MTRKELHEFAIKMRNYIHGVWEPGAFKTKRYQLYCKCRGVIMGDRVELSIFHHDDSALHRRAFGD